MKELFKVVDKKVNDGIAEIVRTSDAKDFGFTPFTKDLLEVKCPETRFDRFDVYVEGDDNVAVDHDDHLIVVNGYCSTACVIIAHLTDRSDKTQWVVIYWTGDEFIIEKNCKLVRYIREVLHDDGFTVYSL